MNLLLLSNGFHSKIIFNRFKQIVSDSNYKKANIITTAHPKKENAIWAKKTFQQFNDLGLKTEFVDFDKGENIDDDVDVIYVCGGNTYNLLVSSRSINFLEKLEKFFSRGGLYVGSSAGSVLVSRDIDSAGLIGSDKNKTDLKDFSGLQVIDKYIIPHSNSKDHQKVKQFMEEKNVGEEDFIFIEDNTAYYLRNGDMEKIK